ncbi:hypothetical protein [Bradyrhizobium sp. 23]|uniref:hypothetical protein n=1 Tax=Bradyrhizobium sp. 23 TaxID=2782667 RepID=UPI001FFB331C|nr:hypothetical protein [Bradyrhizobium sp. 23]MCK1317140.1 hypothetical protein [Bradyrhizobium sp. 23]
MNALAAKPDPPADPELAFRDKCDRLRAMKLAQQFAYAEHKSIRIDEDRCAVSLRLAEPYVDRARAKPDAFAKEIEVLDEEIDAAVPALHEHRERLAAERQAEADRIAASFQPRQKMAVRKIADALKQLSQELVEEARIHDEFAAVSPQPSALLPDLSSVFRFCRTDIASTVASAWGERVRSMGIL